MLCVLQDTVDPVIDEQLATFVVNSHHRSHPDHARYEAQLQEQQQSDDNGGDGGDSYHQPSVEHKDIDDEGMDVVNQHDKTSSPFDTIGAMVDDGPEPLNQDLLKKYIMYARAFVKPILHNIDTEKVVTFIIMNICGSLYYV